MNTPRDHVTRNALRTDEINRQKTRRRDGREEHRGAGRCGDHATAKIQEKYSGLALIRHSSRALISAARARELFLPELRDMHGRRGQWSLKTRLAPAGQSRRRRDEAQDRQPPINLRLRRRLTKPHCRRASAQISSRRASRRRRAVRRKGTCAADMHPPIRKIDDRKAENTSAARARRPATQSLNRRPARDRTILVAGSDGSRGGPEP